MVRICKETQRQAPHQMDGQYHERYMKTYGIDAKMTEDTNVWSNSIEKVDTRARIASK